MAIPFGFSAADFATGLHLLHKAIVALRDTKGASSHYNYTIVELEGLESLLQKIQGFENFHTSIEHLETLHFLGHQCHIPLAAFLRQIKALEPDLRFGASDKGIRHKYFKRPSRKIDWVIRLQKHVSELKAAIEPQLTTIGILLQLIDMYGDSGSSRVFTDIDYMQRAASQHRTVAPQIEPHCERDLLEDRKLEP